MASEQQRVDQSAAAVDRHRHPTNNCKSMTVEYLPRLRILICVPSGMFAIFRDLLLCDHG